MPLAQFLMVQGMLFGLFIVSLYLTGGAQGTLPNLFMNFVTFFSGGFLVTMLVKERHNLLFSVLTATLSFNLVTYLIGIAMAVPLPAPLQLAGDFVVVTIFTLTGMYTRLHVERKRQDK